MKSNVERIMTSLKEINDLPFYSATYFGNYRLNDFIHSMNNGRDPMESVGKFVSELFKDQGAPVDVPKMQPSAQDLGCSAFYCRTANGTPLLAKNLDWKKDPVLLLRTQPKDSYHSLSISNLSFCDLLQLNSIQHSLLFAPFVPLDGINEKGLSVSMLSNYGDAKYSHAPERSSVGDFHIIRIILDNCKNVDEAIETFETYNLLQTSVLPLHYIVADKEKSAIIEFGSGKMNVQMNDSVHYLTNFPVLHSANFAKDKVNCERYQTIEQTMSACQGCIEIQDARTLLQDVSVFSPGFQVPSTLWSVVYDIASLEMHINIGQTKKYYRVSLN